MILYDAALTNLGLCKYLPHMETVKLSCVVSATEISKYLNIHLRALDGLPNRLQQVFWYGAQRIRIQFIEAAEKLA